ncbi:protein translocase subunit SecD [Antrihabitans sp. YC2-6]|uniref:protein translocase subunit SecD n=1 Tax=Antrihabitans sp. YC2-6 TaxID=2799498 RepID=UPI0018F38C46|nr:protein translocase subunit SecD [Antrihabitans sp. YC2-6]MBJ8345261.1 protein translocase subunit SecD [Antrihabitans sp. YC2-6]
MSPSQGSVRSGRLLAVFAVLVGVVYALVFFTGDGSPTPKLGIDLQGGTRVTLTARTPDGGAPSQDSLKQAQQIIETRVNGLGVSGSEVLIDGDNLIITVPGDDSSQARSLGQTARLYIRPVLQAAGPSQPATEQPQQPATTGNPAPATEQPPAQEPAQPQSRIFPVEEPTGPEPTPTGDQPAPSTAPTPAAPTTPADSDELTGPDQIAKEIEAAKQQRQSDDPAVQEKALAELDCSKPDPLQGNDDPAKSLVACGEDGGKYLLAPSIIDGQEIDDAASRFDQNQAKNVVTLDFNSTASETWATFTRENINKQAAFVLDSKVVSAPVIRSATPAGSSTEISGDFSAAGAKSLANTLKYGSLPLSFSSSEAETVSASLGLASLKAGLLAGAIGLLAVLIYCLVYYRMLGLLTALSLVLSGVMVYGLLVLLGRWIGFTLDLAGIAGLIIGIGMTADSFVVFFERIKDEMREGRSFRSAVPRGWARAKRTILSGNAVSFIAAAVLYVLAVGQVRGFAFTLGLTTILDVAVVFLVTWPLVSMASRSTFWSKPSINGLGAVQQVAKERRALAAGTSAKEL